MIAIKWSLAAVLTVTFFLFGGVIIEFIFIGVGKVAELSGSPSDQSPSYFMTVVRRVFEFFFGSTLAVYTVIRLVKDLNAFLYLKIFNRLIIAVQVIVVLFYVAFIGFNSVLILVFVPILECIGALIGASYGFNLALHKEECSEI